MAEEAEEAPEDEDEDREFRSMQLPSMLSHPLDYPVY